MVAQQEGRTIDPLPNSNLQRNFLPSLPRDVLPWINFCQPLYSQVYAAAQCFWLPGLCPLGISIVKCLL